MKKTNERPGLLHHQPQAKDGNQTPIGSPSLSISPDILAEIQHLAKNAPKRELATRNLYFTILELSQHHQAELFALYLFGMGGDRSFASILAKTGRGAGGPLAGMLSHTPRFGHWLSRGLKKLGQQSA